MHLNFNFTIVQTLWTLTFAALLVLLVVLLGRDRARRFRWFTASIALVALRLLASRILYQRMAPLTLSAIFLTLALAEALLSLAVLVELARRAFSSVSRVAVLVTALAMLAVGAIVLVAWGPWPAWKTLTADSNLASLRLMQLAAQKIDLLGGVLTVELGLLVALLGRRFGAGWRSHPQRILIGLSTAAISQMAVRGIWEAIALHAVPHSEAEYQRLLGLQEKIYNANSVVYVAVLVWWIVCLWIDEPGAAAELPETFAQDEAAVDPQFPASGAALEEPGRSELPPTEDSTAAAS